VRADLHGHTAQLRAGIFWLPGEIPRLSAGNQFS
jgi:hypothetical protein